MTLILRMRADACESDILTAVSAGRHFTREYPDRVGRQEPA